MPDLTKYGKPVCQLTGTDECKWHFICKVLEEPVEDLDNCPDDDHACVGALTTCKVRLIICQGRR